MGGPSSPQQQNSPANQSSSDEIRYLAVGRIVKPHGLQGEVSTVVLTDFPERFETTEWFYLGTEYEAEPYRLVGYRWHKQNVLLSFETIVDRTQAETLRGLLVQIPVEEAMPLPAGKYYLYQLLGLHVITAEGQFLGVIGDILETGANDVYVIKSEATDILLPAIPDVVKQVDLEAGQMVVHLLEGLI